MGYQSQAEQLSPEVLEALLHITPEGRKVLQRALRYGRGAVKSTDKESLSKLIELSVISVGEINTHFHNHDVFLTDGYSSPERYKRPEYEHFNCSPDHEKFRRPLSDAIVYGQADDEMTRILDETIGRMIDLNGNLGALITSEGRLYHMHLSETKVITTIDLPTLTIQRGDMPLLVLQRGGDEFTTGDVNPQQHQTYSHDVMYGKLLSIVNGEFKKGYVDMRKREMGK